MTLWTAFPVSPGIPATNPPLLSVEIESSTIQTPASEFQEHILS